MKLTFTITDIQEISTSAYYAFISTFNYISDDSDSSSESDLEDFDPNKYGCDEITESVENMVESYSEICHPLEAVYGKSGSAIIKDTIVTATEESQCAGLKFFSAKLTNQQKRYLPHLQRD